MIPAPYSPMASGPLGHHDPHELRRREIRNELVVAQVSRARRLRRWSARLNRLARILSEAAAALRVHGFDSDAR